MANMKIIFFGANESGTENTRTSLSIIFKNEINIEMSNLTETECKHIIIDKSTALVLHKELGRLIKLLED